MAKCKHPVTLKLKTAADDAAAKMCISCHQILVHNARLGWVEIEPVPASLLQGSKPLKMPLTPEQEAESVSIDEQLARGEVPEQWRESIEAAREVTKYAAPTSRALE